MDTQVTFRPYRGTEEKIKNLPYRDGAIYFSTDTKKIFLDVNNIAKVSMGGNSTFYYGKMIFSETPDEGQIEFTFNIQNDLEINTDITENLVTPNIGDLIINIPDGGFYKVVESLDNETLLTHRIAISGTGGGGNSGGDITTGRLVLDRITPQTQVVLYQSDFYLEFEVTATDSSGETTGDGTYSISVGGIRVIEGIAHQGKNKVNIGKYLGLESNNVLLTVAMDIGGSSNAIATKKWNIQTVQLGLQWNLDESTIHKTNESLDLNWTITGGGDLKKTTYIIIDNMYTVSTNSSTISLTPAEYNLGHGSHKFEIYAIAENESIKVTTDSTVKQLIFAEEGNATPIISVSFFETQLTQYNTVRIPFRIYVSTNIAGTETVTFLENSSFKGNVTNCLNGNVYYWTYTPKDAGIRVLTLQCGLTTKNLTIEVTPLDIKNEEIGNYAFRFKANEFANNESVQAWESNGITANFSEKFDWINGGLKTETVNNGIIQQFLCIKAGSSMTINYKPFRTDITKDKGKCFKMIFKATKCRDYDAEFLSCMSSDIGLTLKAQTGIFKSSTNTITVPYCEDQYIEFEIDITEKGSDDNVKRYIQPWLDGVPAGVVVYTSDIFSQTNPTTITIGSADCDIYIYLIKMYERHLTNDEHLSNFIADAPTAEEMLSRYRRNDILNSTNGEISPTKLAIANKDCYVHMYEMSRMTLNKNDKIKNCLYTQYHGSDNAALSATGVTVKVQGTSSAAYGLAAYNLDSSFENGFALPDGTIIEKWGMSETSIPVNYFCTKVNVASAEGANNALNQEFYNKFQPYKTLLKCRPRTDGKVPRDTMEFIPGVVFIKDLNKSTDRNNETGDNIFKDTVGYIDNPYYKMYSIGCMGNSKKNVEAIHDIANPKECCIENGDNQLPGQWMTIPQGGYVVGETFTAVDLTSIEKDKTTLCPDGNIRNNWDLWVTGMDEIYSFRYPEGMDILKEGTDEEKEAVNEMMRQWFDFVMWMAKSNPSEKYEQVTITSEEEFQNIYKTITEDGTEIITPIFTAPIDENGKLTGVHFIVDHYSEDYSNYYIETAHVFGATNEPLEEEKTFSNYTFKGYTVPPEIDPDRLQEKSGYVSSIKGYTENSFAGTYTHDTTRYRIAKMLSECEEHLNMESILYHYLFIERHTMVDNVAKNTFWSTEDGKVWNLTKNYDNDTSDGNDNQGKLTLTYGYEPGDLRNNISVFNAPNSIWLNFVRYLTGPCQLLYQSLESTGPKQENAWSVNDYLNAFNQWQSTIPERCWIEDYYRKYIRPFELYSDSMFIGMLEGGKKTHQREQYETYQGPYISSKYFGTSTKNSKFIMRPNSDNLSSLRLPVKVYADCYLKGAFGSGTENVNYTKRVKRNEIYYIESPIAEATDATVYLYPANLYQVLGDKETGNLGDFELKQFTSEGGKKLRTLALGVYKTDDDKTNKSLNDISFGANELLEELYVANLAYEDENGKTIGDLNLINCPNLKTIDARNSTFSSLILAENAPVENIYINGPTTIQLSNLNDIEHFIIQNPNKVKILNLNNIDSSKGINSKNLVDECENLERYKLTKVDWILQDSLEFNTLTDPYKINILERLLSDTIVPITGDDGEPLSTAVALTGKMKVTEEAYNENNSFNIYNQYAQEDVFPLLDIDFEGTNSVLHLVTILDGNNDIVWERRIKNNTIITNEFLEDGPYGKFDLNKIYRSSTASHTYTFEGNWEVIINNEVVETISNSDFGSYGNIINDVIFKPIFIEQDHYYTITILDGDKTELLKASFKYGSTLADIEKELNKIPYKDDSKLALIETYSFKGYGLLETSTTPITEDYIVSNDQVLYSIFEKVDDIHTIIHPEWYTYSLANYKGIECYAIAPSTKTLKGKITIPAMHNNLPVLYIGGFGNTNTEDLESIHKITHIFFEENSEMHVVRSYAFNNLTTLKYFEFNKNTITDIEDYGFRRCPLINTTLSETLEKVGNLSFNQAFSSDNITTIYIPSSVYVIGDRGFSILRVKADSTLVIGSAEKLSLLDLAQGTTNADTLVKFSQNADGINKVIFYTEKYSSVTDIIRLNGEEIGTVQTAFGNNNNITNISILQGE